MIKRYNKNIEINITRIKDDTKTEVMCSVWTVCQSMPHKPLVKAGTGAPLPVWQRASSLQRLIAEAGSWLWLLASYLSRFKQLLGITLAA